MRKGFFYSSFVIAAGTAAAFYFYWYAPASRSIYGTLTSVTSKKPLPYYEVELESVVNPIFRRTHTTDENGWFSFADLPEGKYRVTAYNRDRSGSVAREVERGERLAFEATFRIDNGNK